MTIVASLDLSSVLVLIGTILSSNVLSSWIQGKFNQKKVTADAAQILLDKTLEWAGKLSARIELLEQEVAKKDNVIAELRAQIAHLETCKLDK